MAEQDADLAASWNGQSGERWVANQARLDAVVAAFGRAAIEAAAPAKGERVVDVGCGAAENDWVRLPMGVIKGILPPSAARSRSVRPIFVRRPGAGVAHSDGGWLHRYSYCALRCFRPVRKGRDTGCCDRRRRMALEVGLLSRAVFAGVPGERSVMINGAAWIVMARNPAS
ncbi:hypothetical protein J2X15_001944 [Rhodoferax saidenbachensis]|uniref:Methyltransferase type 11 domain-containing protein n=1 Tax=Rhodoferax saidenbachensis TaxID=1484693 RepID=A0ABU1ZQ56_9BURK|nr:hypothetical protein [Rhodoferax saidenbachensis]